MKNIKYSIIICAYNVENYIEKALNSVLNQTYTNYEIIVVNDKSEDETLKKIEKYNNLIIINNEMNRGLGASRNIGVSNANGEYIIHLDADDILYENSTLQKVNDIVEKEKPDIAYFGVRYIGGSNQTYLPNAQNSTREARILCDMHFAVASKCWRKEFLEENNIKFVEDMYYEDMVYSIKSAILAKKTAFGEFPIYKYLREREGSIMTNTNIKKCTDMYTMLAHILSLYDITPDEDKPYLLTFIKQETLSLPKKVHDILEAMKNNEHSPIFEKRKYVFNENDEDVIV